MITTITDKQLAQTFSNTPKTLGLWKKSDKKNIRERYIAFKERALMTMNGFSSVLDLIEENAKMKKELIEYAQKMEALREIRNHEKYAK